MPTDRSTFSRLNEGWLSAAEQRAIAVLARYIPDGVAPDHLTALGFAASVVALVAYMMAAADPIWLWVVNGALIVNWFGDSLDGELARARRAERVRYGFFLDQSTDVMGQFLFALGLGLSGYVHLAIATIGVAVYLMMTVQGLLRAEVTRVFHLAAGGIGLTEVRCLFFLFNAVLYFLPPHPFLVAGVATSYADLLGLAWIAVNLGLYLVTMAGVLKTLGREEPPRPSKSPETRG